MRVSLSTVGGCASEMGRVYRRALKGDMPWVEAAAASLVLHRLRQALEVSALEERLAAVEERLEIEPKPNGRPGNLHAPRYRQ